MRTTALSATLGLALWGASLSAFAADVIKAGGVTKDQLGQEVTVEGTAGSFRASRGEKSPNSFMLKDGSGEVRVVIWPNVYDKIANRTALEKDGAKVRVSGEVAEYREKIELHVNQAEGVKISGGDSGTSGTSAAASQTSGTK